MSNMEEEKMKFVRLWESTHTEIKVEASKVGKTMIDFIDDLLNVYKLSKNKPVR